MDDEIFLRNVVSEELFQQRRIADEKIKRRKEISALFHQLTVDINNDLLNEICGQEIANVAKLEFR